MSEAFRKLVSDENCTYLIRCDPKKTENDPDGFYEGYILQGDKIIGWLTSYPPNHDQEPRRLRTLENLGNCPKLWDIGEKKVRNIDKEIAARIALFNEDQSVGGFESAHRHLMFAEGLQEYQKMKREANSGIVPVQDFHTKRIIPPDTKGKREL